MTSSCYREFVSEGAPLKADGAPDVIQLAVLDPGIPQASRPEPSLSSKLIAGGKCPLESPQIRAGFTTGGACPDG